MNYSVTIEPVVGNVVKEITVNSESKAITQAKLWSVECIGTENGVYISFYRKSDGQVGYINPDGAGISGKDWSRNLVEEYSAWRKLSQEMLDDGMSGSLDCGESSVRQDFTKYAELSETISFESMIVLENEYLGK